MNVRRWQCTWVLACGVIAAGCSLRARYAETASERDLWPLADASVAAPVHDAGPPVTGIEPPETSTIDELPPPGPPPPPAAPSCPSDLAARLTVTRVDVDVDIRYRDATTDSFPMDQRIALGVARDGRAYVAWTDLSAGVRVTPLDAELKRAEPDILVEGQDIGGFVVRDDGFAVLTRRTDPGEPLADVSGGGPVKAAFLARYRGRTQSFAVPLTGTKSITASSDPKARDCAPYYLYGRLAWNGARYGAYFQVYACSGDPHAGGSSDKLVYVDDDGRPSSGGWGWNCSNNLGVRMVPEPGPFTAVCLSDSMPAPGLNLVTEGAPARQLSPEFTQAAWAAAVFGSLMKVPADGSYALGWLSRGLTTAQGRAAPTKQAYDIALLRLGPDYAPLGPKKWLSETSDVAEINLHVAPYGRDRMLVTWERIENPRCTDRTCWGPYSGTRARVIDLDGNPLSADAVLTTPPNTGDDIVVFPNGDLGWAFVADDARSYENPVSSQQRPASKRQLSIARLRVCE